MKTLPSYTFGMGDRFAHQGAAQIQAILNAKAAGITVAPVWNKSFREHGIVGSQPDDVRAEADAAVTKAGWTGDYFVDADHIGLKTVDSFLPGSDFFTLDVADFVGQSPDPAALSAFLNDAARFEGALSIPGIDHPFEVTRGTLEEVACKFLAAIQAAKAIYTRIAEAKGADSFATEVSIDETDLPQTPVDLLLILFMIAREGIPAQTIAPKFTGRFNKGVEYVGDLVQFEKEFDQDLHVIAYAVKEFGLPETLKLSVHSGSDKFSLYPIINRLVKQHGVGLHVKTAGTTWLEEVIGLAEAGGSGLDIAKEIYAGAFQKFDALTAPYATVIDIDRDQLPTPDEVNGWSAAKFADTLRHDAAHPDYNANFRQLIHVGFKIAALLGDRYTQALSTHADTIGRNVTHNLWERHIRPIFG
jgi:tagaturonate epimerase